MLVWAVVTAAVVCAFKVYPSAEVVAMIETDLYNRNVKWFQKIESRNYQVPAGTLAVMVGVAGVEAGKVGARCVESSADGRC